MDIGTKNSLGTINISLKAVADLAGTTISSVYGIVGLVSRKGISNPLSLLLKKENFSDGVTVKKTKQDYELSLYVVMSKDVKIAEVAYEAQKQVSFQLAKKFGISFKKINILVLAVR